MICNRYRVTAKGISAEGEILIRIYPPAYWDLLQIRRNKTLYVEESTSVMISRDILEVRMRFFSIGFQHISFQKMETQSGSISNIQFQNNSSHCRLFIQTYRQVI